MNKGIILKGVGGVYQVKTEQGVISCTLRGRLRLEQERILVGDTVKVSCEGAEGVVEDVLPRRNELTRPPIANVDQVLAVFAVTKPEPSLLLLDRILVNAHFAGMKSVAVFNKSDLDNKKAVELARMYTDLTSSVLITSAKTKEGLESLRGVFEGLISTLAGPSGAGKSSLLNALEPSLGLEIKEVSARVQRGRHTTRKVHLLPLAGGYVADTPGFSRLTVDHIPAAELQFSFPEMGELADECQFRGCLHHREPGCAIKEAVDAGIILAHRYSHYLTFLKEIQAVPYHLQRGGSN
ncbi:MAG TPA: ribosome small subunit-dependent GTPase A [Firmicutes bacterium]|nr:ribosome small subunit-dependent GTPase A [Bacillota bacterium]